MMIGMALVWAIAVGFGFAWLVRDAVGHRRQDVPTDDALTVLDRRFAEGAISLDEHKQRRGVLTDAAARKPIRKSPS